MGPASNQISLQSDVDLRHQVFMRFDKVTEIGLPVPENSNAASFSTSSVKMAAATSKECGRRHQIIGFVASFYYNSTDSATMDNGQQGNATLGMQLELFMQL
jgi:hypothetical protein